MAKDPAFLFYPNDWKGGTELFNRHEKGAYMDILIAQFNNGHLAADSIKFILNEDFPLWDLKLKEKFDQDSTGKFYNARLEKAMEDRKRFTESRRQNASKKKEKPIDQEHMLQHMGNRNGNRNTTINSEGGVGETDLVKFQKLKDKFISDQTIFSSHQQAYLISFEDYKIIVDEFFTKKVGSGEWKTILMPDACQRNLFYFPKFSDHYKKIKNINNATNSRNTPTAKIITPKRLNEGY